MSFLPEKLVMVDCEMTGVDPTKHKLLQAAFVKLQLGEDFRYHEVGEPLVLFFSHDGVPTNNFHKKYLTHIFKACNESSLLPEAAKELVHDWLGDWKGIATPVGDCVISDLDFLKLNGVLDRNDIEDDEQVPGTFHYEIFDLNAVKAIARQKRGEKFTIADIDEEHVHDALVDCRNQTKELNAFLDVLLPVTVEAAQEKTITLYHGTRWDKPFKLSVRKTNTGVPAIFLTDSKTKARWYAEYRAEGETPVVLGVTVRFKKMYEVTKDDPVLQLDPEDEGFLDGFLMQKKKEGYDLIKFPKHNGHTEYAVLKDSSVVKQAKVEASVVEAGKFKELMIEQEDVELQKQANSAIQKGNWKKKLTRKQLAKHWYDMAYGDWGQVPSRDEVEEYEDMVGDTMYWELKSIPVADIEGHHDGHDASTEYIEDYKKQKEEGSAFPPIIVIPTENGKWKTKDGQHRLFAAKKLGEQMIDAYVPIDYVAEAGASGDWKKEGFKLSYTADNLTETGHVDPTIENFCVHMKDTKGNIVGSVQVWKKGKKNIFSNGTYVEPEHRRKGIASAMYHYAEKISGKKFLPADKATEDSESMSSDARRLWDNETRAFGEVDSTEAGAHGNWKAEGYTIHAIDPKKDAKNSFVINNLKMFIDGTGMYVIPRGDSFADPIEDVERAKEALLNGTATLSPSGPFVYAMSPQGSLAGFVSAEGSRVLKSWVEEKARRKGLASAMYGLAESQLKGQKLKPDVSQTPDAKKLWEQPDRAFGGAKGDWEKEGYKIKGKGEPFKAMRGGGNWEVNAFDKKGKLVGTLLVYNLGHEITSSDVKVDKAHRRKGLASAMYEYAEEETGMTMVPADQVSDDEDNMTEDAKKLWDQPNRSFGGAKGDWKKEGYTIKHVEHGNAIKVAAYDKAGNKVGSTDVFPSEDGFHIEANETYVDEAHQRKGIASAMYEYAEKIMGLPMQQLEGGQTGDGNKFWHGFKNSKKKGSMKRIIKSSDVIDPMELPVAVQPATEDDGKLPFDKKELVDRYLEKGLRADTFQDFQVLLDKILLEAELVEDYRVSVAGILNEYRWQRGYVAL
jgi:GNAT superfamily N-acetyltransferase/oligoribonuclease (3'-5' exoribonuclease)